MGKADNLVNMVTHMDKTDVVELGNKGKLDGMTAFIDSKEIEELSSDLQEGILKGLDADYLQSEGGDFESIAKAAAESSTDIRFDDGTDERTTGQSEVQQNSAALDALRASLKLTETN